MLYGQNWYLWYEFARDQHEAKRQEAAHYRLLKLLRRQMAKPVRPGSWPHWWKPQRTWKTRLTTVHVI